MERRVTPPRRVTSPTWGPPPPCKQALSEIDILAVTHKCEIDIQTFLTWNQQFWAYTLRELYTLLLSEIDMLAIMH